MIFTPSNNQILILRCTLVTFGVILIMQTINADVFKNLKYALLILPLVLKIGLRIKIFYEDHFIKRLLLFFLVLSLVQLISIAFTNSYYSERFYKECFLIIAPATSVALVYHKNLAIKSIQLFTFLFYLTIFTFLLETYLEGNLADLLSVSFLGLLAKLVMSDAKFESTTSFIFGLFTLFFFFKERKVHGVFALLFLIISFKRIAILGALTGLLSYFFITKQSFLNRHLKLIFIIIIILINFIVPLMQISIALGSFDDVVENITGITTNHFTQGRQYIYDAIVGKFGLPSFPGEGIGSLNSYLINKEDNINNVHSDLLKNLYEFGYIFYALWVFFFYAFLIKRKNVAPLCLALYINIVFITDNVMIYYEVMFVYYLMIVTLLDDEFVHHLKKVRLKLIALSINKC